MSDDRPPQNAGAGADSGDTPREGTPAFEELDGPAPQDDDKPIPTSVLDATTDAAHRKDTLQMNRRANVTLPDGLIGPAPDHASAYVPPHSAPKPAAQKTLELDLVRVAPDPRRAAATQKLPRIPKRGDFGYVEPKPAQSTPDADDETDPDVTAPPSSKRPGIGGLISIGVLAFAAVFVIGIILFRAMGGGTSRSTTPPEPAPTEATPTATPQPPEQPGAGTSTAASTETPPETSSAEPATSAPPKPTAPQTTKPGKTEVKSPASTGPGPAEPINN
jgi:hypothetical protein